MPGLCIIPSRALDDEECRGARMTALLAIGTYTSRDGSGVWAANETIAERAKLDERDYRRAVAWLVERGYVRKRTRYKQSGAQDTNLLQIVLDEPDEPALPLAIQGGGGISPTPPEGEGSSPPPREGSSTPPREGSSPPPRGGVEHPTKRTPLNVPSEHPRVAAAAGAKPRTPLQQLAAAANRAFDERFGTDRQPIVSNTATNLLEAITQRGIPLEWAVQAVYEAALKSEITPRSVQYFTAGVLERWEREQARSDAQAFVPAAVPGVVPRMATGWSAGRQAFWDLCVTGGLAAGMQSRDTIAERVQVLHRDGRVSDPAPFLALVLHVKPWKLAEIKFVKERDERLAAALASFTAPAAQEVA